MLLLRSISDSPAFNCAVLEEARELGIVVLCTQHTNFTTCGLLYQAGIRGTDVRTGAK